MYGTKIPHWSFEDTWQALLVQWENLLQRIDIASNTPENISVCFIPVSTIPC